MEEQKKQQLNRFKIEKENTIQYPIKELLKDSINDWILSDIQQINMKLGQELRLISKVNNKDDIKRLKCFVKNNKSNLPSMLYDELKSEVKEIAEDFEWVRSKDGQIILEIENWIEKARLRLREEYPDTLIYIGRGWVNPMELIIGGVVDDDDTQKFFENYFNNQTPPVPIHFKIIIQN